MRHLSIAVVALAGMAVVAGAQTPQAFVKVVAHDSTGAPVVAARVSVTRGLKDVIAQGITDAKGQSVVAVETRKSTDVQITVRKIGYTRADQFLAIDPRDTAVVPLTIEPSHMLDTVKVTARGDQSSSTSYSLSADEIDASNQPIKDGWDMLKRLRPIMLTGEGSCGGGARQIWINGMRIQAEPPAGGSEVRDARLGWGSDPSYAAEASAVAYVLRRIAPEHVESVSYRDCFDTSVTGMGTKNAVFVTLKPGITYDERAGSVIDQSTKGG